MDATNAPAVQRRFSQRGGWLCLDFANTVGWHAGDHPAEWLMRYEDLVAWSRQMELLDAGEARRLVEAAGRHPRVAAAGLRKAKALRETIYRIFDAAVDGRPPDPRDMAALNAALAQAWDHLRLETTERGFGWRWLTGESAAGGGKGVVLDRVLWPIARSAADLLTSEQLGRVRQCAGDPCGWLFLDMSKNRSRRWCAMADCGNRAKTRRHLERRRGQQALTQG